MKFPSSLILVLALVFAEQSSVFAAVPAPEIRAEKACQALLWAVQINYFEKFIEDGDSNFKRGMSPGMLESVSKQLGARLKGGYEMKYVGSLRQQGAEVHLWRIEFKDKGDDVLAKLAWKGKKVAGFWLQ